MSTKIVSFDIGIKNLAYCIINKEDKKIIDWGIINIVESFIEKLPKCVSSRKGKICNKLAINYIKTEINYKINYCDNKFCQNIMRTNYSEKKIRKIKKFKTKSVPLIDIGKLLFEKLKEKKIFLECNQVIIENQPVLKNPTMKSIQMMVYSFFLLNQISNVKLFNPSRKLDIYDGPEVECNLKNDYNKRKFLSIKYTEYLLRKSNQCDKFLNLFENSSKKDDLSDCYLQCLTYINKT
jgi:hypothetical protein